MNAPEGGVQILTEALADQVKKSNLYINVTQNAIFVSEDKVRLCLMKHLSRMESKSRWIAPAGILSTIIATLATSQFHNAILDAAVWHALFLMSAIGSFAWLVVTLIQAIRSPKVDDVVEELKQATEKQNKEASNES